MPGPDLPPPIPFGLHPDMNRLSALERGRFVVLGRAGMDLYADPPGASVESVERFVACLGGSSANIAVAISRQGGSTTLVTTISDDAVGRFCLGQLDRYEVNRDHVRVVSGAYRTSMAVADSRVEDHQCVLYRNGAADFRMTAEDVEAVDYRRFGGLIATGTVLAEEPSRSAGFRGLELARQAGLVTIFDIDYRPHSWVSDTEAAEILTRAGSLCDIVIGNDVEFDFMAGKKGGGLRKARELAGSTAAVAVYKMGEHGAFTICGDTEIGTGVFAVDTLKPIGAGDGFMGGFVAGLASGYSLEESVIRGNATAAMVVSRVGCAPAMPDSAEVDGFMAAHPRPDITHRTIESHAHSST